MSVSPHKSDFVGPLKAPPLGLRLRGIAKGLPVAGVGQVAWSFVDSTNMLRTIQVPAYYVPKAAARLLSTSSLLQTYPDETLRQTPHEMVLSGNTRSSLKRNSISVLIEPESNLPIGFGYSSKAASKIIDAFTSTLTTVSKNNANLSAAEKELLQWHYRLGHLQFRKIQFLMRTGVLAHSESARRLQTAAAKLSSCPLCASCQYGKQRRRPAPGKTSSVVRDK
ncbi:MAG: GAG-pre-integrase domain-containing protein, partial [Marinobacter sp.]